MDVMVMQLAFYIFLLSYNYNMRKIWAHILLSGN